MDQGTHSGDHQQHECTQAIEFHTDGGVEITDGNPCQVGLATGGAQKEQQTANKGTQDRTNRQVGAETMVFECAECDHRCRSQRQQQGHPGKG